MNSFTEKANMLSSWFVTNSISTLENKKKALENLISKKKCEVNVERNLSPYFSTFSLGVT